MRNYVKDSRGLNIAVHDSQIGAFIEWCKPGNGSITPDIIDSKDVTSAVIRDWELEVFNRLPNWRDIPQRDFDAAYRSALRGQSNPPLSLVSAAKQYVYAKEQGWTGEPLQIRFDALADAVYRQP